MGWKILGRFLSLIDLAPVGFMAYGWATWNWAALWFGFMLQIAFRSTQKTMEPDPYCGVGLCRRTEPCPIHRTIVP